MNNHKQQRERFKFYKSKLKNDLLVHDIKQIEDNIKMTSIEKHIWNLYYKGYSQEDYKEYEFFENYRPSKGVKLTQITLAKFLNIDIDILKNHMNNFIYKIMRSRVFDKTKNNDFTQKI
ncbi:MAG: hypothetical protein FWF57_07965 [Defluviitaleaceae bacterium]|nr:hypothetical protein [Defluviitaleaceae bacterium]